MAKSNIIKVLIDGSAEGLEKSLTKAKTALNGFKSNIAAADGAGGKLKAGFSSIGDTLKSNMGPALLTAGASLVAFGVKAVGVFTDTAKAAIDLSTSTGLSVEEASKWIAIGDDFEVNAQALATGLGKIAKTMDDTKWAEYGIATRDAGGEARSVNDIFIDTVTMLSEIENETERARIGQELFGKGYQSLTPILGKTKEEYQAMMDQVSAGQVITEKEAKKAERMRLAQDALNDALNDVTLAFGGMVAEMSPVIEGMAGMVTKAIELKDALGPLPDLALAVTQPFIAVSKSIDLATGSAENLDGLTLDQFQAELEALGWSEEDIAEATEKWAIKNLETLETVESLGGAAEDTAPYVQGLSKDIRDEKDAAAEAEGATRKLTNSISDLQGQIGQRQSWLSLQDSYDDYLAVQADANASDREREQSLLSTQSELIDYANSLENLPEEKKTAIMAKINSGDIDGALWELGKIPTEVKVNVKVNQPIIPRMGAYADGTNSAAPGLALVGEEGPELVEMRGGEKVHTASATRRMMSSGGGGNTYVSITLPVGTDPRRAAEEARRYQKRTGRQSGAS